MIPAPSHAGRDAGVVSVPFRPGAQPPILRLGQRQAVYRAGDPVEVLFEVIDGAVMLSVGLGDGRRQIVEIARRGAVVGFAGTGVQPLDAETLAATQLRVFGRSALAADRALELRVNAAAMVRLAALEEHILLLGRKSALERVASFLISFAEPERDRIDLLGLTRQEIGDHLGLTIETVSRNISRLKGQGVISIDRAGTVRVRDRAALWALTGRSGQTPM